MNIKEPVFNTYLPKIEALSLSENYERTLLEDMEYILKQQIPNLRYIILFGSCARGSIKAGSDIDLLLITEDLIPRELRGDIASHLDGLYRNISTDVIFYTADSFNQSCCTFVQEVKKDGVIIWEYQSKREVGR